MLVVLLDEAPDDGLEPAPALPPLGPLEDLPGERLELLVLAQHDRPQVLVDGEVVPLLGGRFSGVVKFRKILLTICMTCIISVAS